MAWKREVGGWGRAAPLALAWLLLSAAAAGAAVRMATEIRRAHYLEFDRRGRLTAEDEIEAVLDGIRAHENGRLIFFIHGANNSHRRAAKRANAQAPLILDAGQYPVFLNWESSFLTSYRDDLFRIHQGKDRGVSASSLLAPFRFAADVGKMVFRTPWVASQQVKTMVRTRRGGHRNNDILKGVEAIAAAWPDHIWLGEVCPKSGARGARAAEVGVVTAPTTKLATNMVMDAFGPGAWDVLQRRTRLLFEDDEYFRTRRRDPPGSGPWSPRDGSFSAGAEAGGLAKFLDRLVELIDDDDREWRIVLAGHSTGTLVVNEILRRYPAEQLPVERLVYMAAASSSEDLDRDVIARLEQLRALPAEARPKRELEIFHLTLHPWQENRQAMLYDIGPRGSIIVAVDDFIDKPKTTTSRVAGRLDNLVRQVQKWPPEVRDVSYVKAFGAGHCEDMAVNHPKAHGHFSTRLRYWEDVCVRPGSFPAWCGDLSATKPSPPGGRR